MHVCGAIVFALLSHSPFQVYFAQVVVLILEFVFPIVVEFFGGSLGVCARVQVKKRPNVYLGKVALSGQVR